MSRFEANIDGSTYDGVPYTSFDEYTVLTDIFTELNWDYDPIYEGIGGYYLFHVNIGNGRVCKIHIYLKRITFGGRENYPYEKRAQFSASLDRKGFISQDQESEFEFSLILGIYKNEKTDMPVICAWDIHQWGYNMGRAFNCFTDVRAIANAYKDGIFQHKSAKGQISCCFTPSNFLYYLDNREKLHKEIIFEKVNGKLQFVSLVDDFDYYDDIPRYPALFQTIIDILKKYDGVCNIDTMESEAVIIWRLTEYSRVKIHNPLEGSRTELGYQLAWARFYLKKAGFIESPKRSVWILTEKGWNEIINKNEIIKLATDTEFKNEDKNLNLFDIQADDDIETEKEIDSAREDIIIPFDPNLVDIRTRTLSLDLLLRRLKTDGIDLNTSFQRKSNLWDFTKQSRLIESILVKFPLPAFYFDGSNDDNWLVVDGLQRLSSLDNFVNRESFALRNLEFLNQFNGFTFSKLPAYLQRRIEEFQITAYVIAAGTPTILKFNVFKRINTGGLTLTSQEIRNALYQGEATKLVRRLSELKSFKKATAYTIPVDRMLDQEFVSRFLAFYLFDLNEYYSDLDGFMNKAMDHLNNDHTIDFSLIEQRFDKAMETAYRLFENDAFRKRYHKNDRRKPINKALFEVWSVLLSKLNTNELALLVKSKNDLKTSFISLLNNDIEFNTSITSGTSDKNRVRKRFKAIKSLIESTINQNQ